MFGRINIDFRYCRTVFVCLQCVVKTTTSSLFIIFTRIFNIVTHYCILYEYLAVGRGIIKIGGAILFICFFFYFFFENKPGEENVRAGGEKKFSLANSKF